MAPDGPNAAVRRHLIAYSTAIASLAWVASIWIHRFLPLTDYPRWLHTGQVFAQLVAKQAPSCYSLIHYPVPNTVFVLATGLLDHLVPCEVSGKIFLSVCVIFYILGCNRLVGSLSARRDSPLLLVPLLYIFHLGIWLGELSYSFGLGVLFLAVSHMLAPSVRRPTVKMWLVCGLSVLIFYCHAIPYLCWLIFLALLSIFDDVRFPRGKLLAAISPSLVLMCLYAWYRQPSNQPPTFSVAWFLTTLSHARRFGSVFAPLHAFEPFYMEDPQWVSALMIAIDVFAVAGVLVLIGLWLRLLLRREYRSASENSAARAVLLSPAVFLAIFLIVPLDVATGVEDANYRFLLPAFMLILAGLAANFEKHLSDSCQWALTIGGIVTVSIVLTFQYCYVGRVSQKLRRVYEVIVDAHLDPSFRDFPHNQFEPQVPIGPRPQLFPVHEPLRYLPDYWRIAKSIPGPVFPTSIIKNSTKYPRFLKAITRKQDLPHEIVVLGLHARTISIPGLLPDEFERIEDTQYAQVLRFTGEPQDDDR